MFDACHNHTNNLLCSQQQPLLTHTSFFQNQLRYESWSTAFSFCRFQYGNPPNISSTDKWPDTVWPVQHSTIHSTATPKYRNDIPIISTSISTYISTCHLLFRRLLISNSSSLETLPSASGNQRWLAGKMDHRNQWSSSSKLHSLRWFSSHGAHETRLGTLW